MRNKSLPALFAFLCLSLLSMADEGNAIRTWTNKTGQTMEAVLLSVQQGKASFRKKDGSVFDYNIADLSDADQKIISAAKPGPDAGGKPVDFLGLPVQGPNVVICMNAGDEFEKSCEGGTMTTLETAFKSLVESLPETSRLNVIFFHRTVEKFRPNAELMTDGTRQAALAFASRYFTPGGNKFGHTRADEPAANGKDAQGISFTGINSNDFAPTKNTAGGSRCDLGLLAAFADGPSTVILLTHKWPSVVSREKETKELGIPKVKDIIGAAWRNAPVRPRIHVVIPTGSVTAYDEKKAVEWKKDSQRAFESLASMSGGKVLPLKAK